MPKTTKRDDIPSQEQAKADWEEEMYYLNKMLERKPDSFKKFINKGRATSLRAYKAREDIPYQD